MGSKMSSNHHLVEEQCEETDWKLRKKTYSMSSAMEGSKGSNDRDDDSVDGHSTSMSRISAGLSHDFGEDYAGMRGEEEEPAFDINENFDFDSDRLTVDSDMMTMDSICDGYDVVEIGDHRDVGIGKRQRPSRAAILASDRSSEKNSSPEKVRMPNGDISHTLQQLQKLNIKSSVQPVVYKMDYPSRGKAVIVNQTRFDPITGMSNREGTDPDLEGLDRVFCHLGFRTKAHSDLTVAEFRKLLFELSNEDFSSDDCLLFIVMSHGEDGALYCKDGTVAVDELAFRFKGIMCPTLVGKPKLFFIQACRGTQMDHGVRTPAVEGDDEPDAAIAQKMFYTIPVEGDFLMAYSSTPGYYSWRSLKEGSWFIQAIITVFEKYGTCMDVNQMMTRVNRTVAYRYESISSDVRYNGRKQMPCFVSTLTKELYFIPKKQ
ncbi:caspase-3-like isoform X1 [Lytechinus pictus]|uniref:caspase-3-like isoform X1 n=2 Tax=Lytechinus pictus TaxID=7653 RepID=UPI0030B9E4F8